MVAAALLAVLGVSLVLLARSSTEAPDASGTFAVAIIGPGDESLFNGTVQADNATAFTVLEQATQRADLTLQVDTYPSFGSGCAGTYVSAIGPYHAEGSSGWLYRVHVAAADQWVLGPYSSACFALHPGDQVEWRWGTE